MYSSCTQWVNRGLPPVRGHHRNGGCQRSRSSRHQCRRSLGSDTDKENDEGSTRAIISANKSCIRWLMNLVVRRICPFLPMVPSDFVALLIEPRYLLPRTLPKDETSCIILRTLGPFDSVLVNLLPKDVVAQIVGDGLRWHSQRVERWRREG